MSIIRHKTWSEPLRHWEHRTHLFTPEEMPLMMKVSKKIFSFRFRFGVETGKGMIDCYRKPQNVVFEGSLKILCDE